MGTFLPSADGIPHYRVAMASRRHMDALEMHLVHNLADDPHQERPVVDDELEGRLVGKMKELFDRYEAPPCQYERLGLKQESTQSPQR